MLRAMSFPLLAIMFIGCESGGFTDPTISQSSPTELASAPSRTRQIFPLDAPLINSCYNEGAGESIQLSGFIVVTFQTISTPSGSLIEQVHVGTRGVHGVGLTSGIRYQVMEHENNVTVTRDGSRQINFVFVIGIIGAGPGNNERLTSRFRLIIGPDGSFTYVFDSTDHVCR